MRRALALLVLVLIIAGAVFAWLHWGQTPGAEDDGALVLYGNIEIRNAQLAFNSSQRVVKVLVDEGDSVSAGQLLAELDGSRLSAELAAREAAVTAAEQALLRLKNGTRPEEIERARAAVRVAEVRLRNAQRTLERIERSASVGAISKLELDNALAARDSAEAELAAARAELRLAEIGPREEDIAEAQAQLDRLRAERELASQLLADTRLYSPANGIIRTRVIEAGEMVNPAQTAFTLSLTDQKWVRAYVGEANLGLVKPGMAAAVRSDSFPDKRYEGWVGHISPEAEFTSKTVQTEELRTALVYEVRIYVRDPGNELRLGMPVTVQLLEYSPGEASTQPAAGVN